MQHDICDIWDVRGSIFLWPHQTRQISDPTRPADHMQNTDKTRQRQKLNFQNTALISFMLLNL